ncbi:MAG TPA: DUF4491 family protein [Anaerolineales bacterium]|nr:DUF4491 family protein [Anaerolineales bacterium]
MTFNFIGLVAALTAFFSIWFGHIAVRKIEFISPTVWLPISAFAVVGIAFAWFSLSTLNFLISTALGILGITLLFDAFEFVRQQKRIIKGHAPANLNNPRHAKILREHASATTLDVLKREPTSLPLTMEER